MKRSSLNTVLRTIRQNCLECSGDSAKEVALCIIPDCPLYEYRFGDRKDVEENGIKQIIEESERGGDTVLTRKYCKIKKVGKRLEIQRIKNRHS